MASQAGREVMNSEEVAGSIPTVIPTKEKRQNGISHVQEPVKLTHRLENNDESNTIIAKSPQYRKIGEVKSDTGNLIGVPEIIWEICQV